MTSTGASVGATKSPTSILIKLQARELFRNYSYSVFVIVFPFFMFGMFYGMQAIFDASADASTSDGGPKFDQILLPMAMFLGVTGVALTTTAGPVAEYREHGTLCVLGTTPLSRKAFIGSHLLVRVLLATVLAMAVALVGVLMGVAGWPTLVRLFPAVLGGLAIYLGIGYLLGGTISSSLLATNVGTFIQVTTLFLAGIAFPFSLLPDKLASALSWLPTSQFADLLLWAADSPLQRHSPWVSLLYALVFGFVLVLCSIATFRWDTQKR